MTLEQAIDSLRKDSRVYVSDTDTPYHIEQLSLSREEIRDNSGIICSIKIAAIADLRCEFGSTSRVQSIEKLADNKAELINRQIAAVEVQLKLLKDQLQREEQINKSTKP